jgi:hypothetical protein
MRMESLMPLSQFPVKPKTPLFTSSLLDIQRWY